MEDTLKRLLAAETQPGGLGYRRALRPGGRASYGRLHQRHPAGPR